MIFLELSGKLIFLFPKNMISKKAWKYDILCIFSKDGISFSYEYEITLLSKKQR